MPTLENGVQIKSLEYMPYEVLLDTLIDTHGLGKTFIENNPNYAKVAPILRDLRNLINDGGLNNDQITKVLRSFSTIITNVLEILESDTTMLTLNTELRESDLFKKTFIGFLSDAIRNQVGKYRESLEKSPSADQIKPVFNIKGDVSSWSVLVHGVNYNILSLFFVRPDTIHEANSYCRQPETDIPSVATA